MLLLRGLAGTISGRAPLFERFALGDTRTLRGWNKFDVDQWGARAWRTDPFNTSAGPSVFSTIRAGCGIGASLPPRSIRSGLPLLSVH